MCVFTHRGAQRSLGGSTWERPRKSKFYCILVHPALMSTPPPPSAHLSPAGLTNNTGPLHRGRGGRVHVPALRVCQKTHRGISIFHYLPPPPHRLRLLSGTWTESSVPHTPAPPLMTPLCGAVSLARAAAGLLTPLIEMRMSIKRAQEFTAWVHTSKGRSVSACVRARVEREVWRGGGREERWRVLVLCVSSHFQPPCRTKDAAGRFPSTAEAPHDSHTPRWDVWRP